MKVLFVGDSPTVSTGFSRCTQAACNELHQSGHEVSVLGINEKGDPNSFPYAIYPCRQPFDNGYDDWGVTRLPRLIDRLNPDLVVILQDPWNIKGYLEYLSEYGLEPESVPPIVGWIAVDALNQVGHELNPLSHVVTWTQFGINELKKGGYTGTSSVIPLGVDTSVFYPRDKSISRQLTCPEGIPSDAFIVGVVGRNQPRKRLDITISAFSEWVKEHHIDGCFLYLHVAPTGDIGFDIKSLVRYYGIRGKVIIANPNIGVGVPSDHMAKVYSAFDLYLTTTQGEGWGLPCMEAMACGVPCIVPDWSALGEWVENAAVLVPCNTTALNAPLNSLAYTIGGVPDKGATVLALQSLYENANLRADLRDKGLALTSRPEYQWKNVGKSFVSVLESVLDRHLSKRDEDITQEVTELQEAVA